MKHIFILMGCILSSPLVLSQSTTASNFQVGGLTRYLGFANNFSVDIRTSGVNRAMINQNINYTINGYNGQRNGYMLLGTQTASNTDF